jgi:hypothetical protein
MSLQLAQLIQVNLKEKKVIKVKEVIFFRA